MNKWSGLILTDKLIDEDINKQISKEVDQSENK